MTSSAGLQARVVVSVVADALVAGRVVAGSSAELGEALNRLATVSDLATRNHEALDRLSSDLFACADHDATQLLTISRSPDPDHGLVLTLANRVTEDLNSLVVAALADLRRRTVAPLASEPPVVERDDERLVSLAADYGQDAVRERRSSAQLFAASLLAFGGSVASAAWAVHVARGARSEVWIESLGPLILCGAAVVTGLALVRSGAMRGRAAREATRLQRGLSGLDAYLAPLPPAAQHLLRATLAQTLFPRLLEDNDPMRAPVWPDADALLRVSGAFSRPQLSESSSPAPSDPAAGAPSSGALAP